MATYNRQYYENHREEELARVRHRRQEQQKKRVPRYRKSQEEVAADRLRWQRENPEKCAAYKARRKARNLAVAHTATAENIEFERKIGEAMYRGEKLQLHHPIAFSKGGNHSWGNIMFIPALLNRKIHNKLPQDVYKQLSLVGAL